VCACGSDHITLLPPFCQVLGGNDILTSVLYTLGCAYMDGVGVVSNEALALAWFSRGVALGSPQAISRIGVYNMGFCNPVLPVSKMKVRNLAKAKEMLTAAADLGDEEAMTRLGLLLLRGGGTVELGASAYDHGDAIKWLRKAAHSGSFEAEALLALTYFKMKLYSKARQVRASAIPSLADMWPGIRRTRARGRQFAFLVVVVVVVVVETRQHD
jgi:TPR repeat protein